MVYRYYRFIPLFPQLLGKSNAGPKSRFKTWTSRHCDVINFWLANFLKKNWQILLMFPLSQVWIDASVWLVELGLREHFVSHYFYLRLFKWSRYFKQRNGRLITACFYGKNFHSLAEEVRFELTVRFPARWFSKPVP